MQILINICQEGSDNEIVRLLVKAIGPAVVFGMTNAHVPVTTDEEAGGYDTCEQEVNQRKELNTHI